jgi:pre-rRNA-processing protein TSR3
MEQAFVHIPVRSLPPWTTAYPRLSKTRPDPEDGLATIEAIFAAYTILGRPTEGLLDNYLWADQFRALNRGRISQPHHRQS